MAGASGCSVAAALLAAGVERFRETPVGGAPRAPYCMMGVCFDCLVEVREGMAIRSQHGARAPLHTEGAVDGK